MLLSPRRCLRHAAAAAVLLIVLTVFLLSEELGIDGPGRGAGAGAGAGKVATEEPRRDWRQHPVVLLHDKAEADFEALLKRQSKTPDAAEAEYRRRYGRAPPPGFSQWVEYALSYNSPIIDDYDTIAEGVHRFHNLTAAGVALLMHGATFRDQNVRIDRCTLKDGKFNEGCRHFAEPLTNLLGHARVFAPEVSFLINFLDEPSVLVGPAGEDVASWEDLSHQPIAGPVGWACERLGPSPGGGGSSNKLGAVETYGLPFVTDVKEAKDLCRHPEYSREHGFLLSPATFKRMRTEVPLLSQAAPYPFSDVLYPSTHYGTKSSLYEESSDRAWKKKKNAVYWKGSSTGGYWNGENWRLAHRQRVAELGLPNGEREHTYLRSGDKGALEAVTTTAFVPAMYDVALTQIVGCDGPATCGEMKEHFGAPWRKDSEARPFRYRYVLDVDGNSYSGRFYRFLASRSAPLKASLFREWHDERLVPWLHYIPVSPGLVELPELMRFLTTTAEGQDIGRRVADAGRKWYFQALTPEHQGIYLYRLMLELAWLQNEDRPAAPPEAVGGPSTAG